jgi:exodeoxyribonuclease VII large subunit
VTQPEPKSTAEEPWPVRVVSQKLGAWIAKLGWVWVDGQVAQITRRPGSAVVFLTLRDPSADLSLTVTAHRDVLDAGAPELAEGARVTLHAKPEFYPSRGTLSLRADEIRQVGLGELLARLERLKKLLAAEGLFARERKRRPPFLPRRIGLITGRASAAERDVLMNTRRRWPAVAFRVINVAVQGPTAVPQIIDALKVLDNDDTVDLIVLARGGGSVEDLLPFSDETLCRAVAACRTPVVSAIGHEPDTPLVDHVADLRCSTPTEAGRRLVPDLAEETARIAGLRDRARRALAGWVDREERLLAALRHRPVLADPLRGLEARHADVERLREAGRACLMRSLDRRGTDVAHLAARLTALGPAATLARGYAVVQRVPDGHPPGTPLPVLRSTAEAGPGTRLRVRVADGALPAVVETGSP